MVMTSLSASSGSGPRWRRESRWAARNSSSTQQKTVRIRSPRDMVVLRVESSCDNRIVDPGLPAPRNLHAEAGAAGGQQGGQSPADRRGGPVSPEQGADVRPGEPGGVGAQGTQDLVGDGVAEVSAEDL